MLLRGCYAVLIGMVLSSSVGCCWRAKAPWPAGLSWYGPGCECVYWNEWFSHPPTCHDPCDCWGNFVGRKTAWVRHGGPPMGPPPDWPSAYEPEPRTPGEEVAAPAPEKSREPSGATQPEPGMNPALPTEPSTPEDLPPIETEPSASARYNELGQVVGYDEPVDSPPASRTLWKPRRAVRQP